MHIFHTEWSHGWGGQEIRIITEMEALIGEGIEASIACHPDSQIYKEAKNRNFQTYPIKFGTPANLFTIIQLGILARRIKASIIHTHSSKDSWIGGIAGKLFNIPVVRSRHLASPIKTKPTNQLLYRILPSAIIASGETIKKQVFEAARVPQDRIFSVPAGADPKRFKASAAIRIETRDRLGIPEKATVFGMVSVLRSWKGHLLFLEAIEPIIKSDDSIWVLIVGEGPIRDLIESKIDEFGISNQVILTGHCSDPENYYPAMDVHLLPSLRNEATSQSVPQAMMCQIANITSDGGGLTEVVNDGITGLIAKAGDRDSLAHCIAKLSNNPDLRAKLAKAGQKNALENFTFERQVNRTKEAYRFAVSS
tara:strand:- start:2882 stop:3979 length:1098 start_codon:yes stop_codon:yes gene_type:complete